MTTAHTLLGCSQLGVPTWVAVLSFPTDLESVFNPITSRECEVVYVAKCDCHAFVLLMLFIHFHFLIHLFCHCAHIFISAVVVLWVHCICGAFYM